MAAKTVTLDDAAIQLSELVAQASEGEEIVITNDAHVLVKLVPVFDVTSERELGEREFGQFRGRVHVSEDFDEPLPDDFWLGRGLS